MRARRGKGPGGSLPPPPATQRILLPGRGAGRAGARVGRLRKGPSLLTSRGPLLLTFSRGLGSAALARGRAVGPRSGERSRRGLSGAATGPQTGGSGWAGDAPTWSSGVGGCAGFRALEAGSPELCRAPHLRPPPRPATPPRASRRPRGPGDALAPGPPPPLPPPGRRRARSGDVKGRAVAAPPRALVKKKKKRGNET